MSTVIVNSRDPCYRLSVLFAQELDGNGSGIQELESLIRSDGITRAISTMDDVKCTYFKNFPNKIQWRVRLCDSMVIIILQRFFFTTRDALEAAKAATELTSSDFTPKNSNRFSYVWTVTDERMDRMVIVRKHTQSVSKRAPVTKIRRIRVASRKNSAIPISSTPKAEHQPLPIAPSKRVNARSQQRNSGRARSSL
jgi:hypothetical protein